MRGVVIRPFTFSTLGHHIVGVGLLTLRKDLLLRLCSRRSRRRLEKSRPRIHKGLSPFPGICYPRTLGATRRGSISRHAVGGRWSRHKRGLCGPFRARDHPLLRSIKYLTSICTYSQRHHQHSDGDQITNDGPAGNPFCTAEHIREVPIYDQDIQPSTNTGAIGGGTFHLVNISLRTGGGAPRWFLFPKSCRRVLPMAPGRFEAPTAYFERKTCQVALRVENWLSIESRLTKILKGTAVARS